MLFKFFMLLKRMAAPRAMNLLWLLQMLYILNMLFLLENLMALVMEKNIVLKIIKVLLLKNVHFGKLSWPSSTRPLDTLRIEVWFEC